MKEKWISIKDKFPENDTGCLVFIQLKNFEQGCGNIDVARFDEGFYQYKSKQVENITHWMPLPKKPKE